MPTKTRRENRIIEIFLSAYESDSWADAKLDWLDEKEDSAVEVLATRRSDGKTLAMEHTVIEPFVGDKDDFARFAPLFLQIEDDPSLIVPDRILYVYVTVGTLQKGLKWEAVARSVHDWLRANIRALPEGRSTHACAISGAAKVPFDISLSLRVISSPGAQGKLLIRRQQVGTDLGEIVSNALKKKLPKLVNTTAEKRILLLERQHMNLLPEQILEEIERRRTDFPELAHVQEIWIVETMFYESDGHLRFELYRNGDVIRGIDFQHGRQLFKEYADTSAVLDGRKHACP
ncbi:MAG: hypothetical protein ACE5JP_16985 [Candidatus Bipolaricaulia bacterium]